MCERESARVVYESVIPISRMVNITKEGGREVKEERKKKQNMAEFLFFFFFDARFPKFRERVLFVLVVPKYVLFA